MQSLIPEEVTIDTNFSQASFTEKDPGEYKTAKEIIKQVDAYYLDKSTTDRTTKVKNIVTFVKKIQAHAYDNTTIIDGTKDTTLDYKLKYTAATRLMQYVQIILSDKLNINDSNYDDKKNEIIALLDDTELDIKTYWNSSTSRDDLKIKKTDDYVSDLDDKVESRKERINQIDMIIETMTMYV